MQSRLYYTVSALLFCWLSIAYLAACSRKNESYHTLARTQSNAQQTSFRTSTGDKVQLLFPEKHSRKMPVIVVLSDELKIKEIQTIHTLWPDCVIACVSRYGVQNGTKVLSSVLKGLSQNSAEWGLSNDVALITLDASWSEAMLMYTYTHNTNNYVKCVADLSGSTPKQISGVRELKAIYLKPSLFSGENAKTLGNEISNLGVAVELCACDNRAESLNDLPKGVRFLKAHLSKS